MKRRDMILGGFAVLGLGGWYFTSQTGTGAMPNTELPGAANAQTSSADVDTSGIEEMVLGNPDASVTVIEYASYTCPHCANFHNGNYKKLKADYIDTGKIKFIYREVYFDRPGLWASMVARCGGSEKFFGLTDLLYKGEQDWKRAGSPADIAQELGRIGRLAGLDGDTLDACMQDREKAEQLVVWFEQNRDADGVQSTPSFVINGQLYRNMDYPDMKALIDAEIGS
ncbi:DsbA family protein [Sulfitobacter aestuariivivens]|uniref:DsbA family protein n=1 Tax=Sulfitobacter aestuariivivens TaxID=2766981 RepID=A0A927HG71_9RHOB|nr:DsbA family protein [Sulfitobacter aestuariivivens]MBD3665651.1 DsbA family protein [Sulfitobacter aestuariivivens]